MAIISLRASAESRVAEPSLRANLTRRAPSCTKQVGGPLNHFWCGLLDRPRGREAFEPRRRTASEQRGAVEWSRPRSWHWDRRQLESDTRSWPTVPTDSSVANSDLQLPPGATVQCPGGSSRGRALQP